jgi:hypothetical protein
MFRTLLCLLALLLAQPHVASIAASPDQIHTLRDGYRVVLSDPVVVSMASPEERRWGRHQFVSLSRYPGGKLLLRFHSEEDSVKAYGSGQPSFLSRDDGRTWASPHEDGLPGSGLVCQMSGGDFLVMPMPRPLNIREASIEMPPPVGDFFCYRKIRLYRADQCPEPVNEFLRRQTAQRWDSEKAKWMREDVEVEIRDRMAWMGPGNEEGLVSGTTFERPPIQAGSELLWADYRATYLMPDGSAPKGFAVSCFVSMDNGRSWKRRAVIANPDAVEGEISSMTEPVLVQTAKGGILCVIRRTDQTQKSMLLARSLDKGKTWGKPRAMDELGVFGVMPDLARLESGPLVLSYGRPGVQLSFSLDGTGEKWESPLVLVASGLGNRDAKTDGYTSLVPLGAGEFLIGYSDFEHLDDLGRKRKAILVRRLKLESK